MTCDRSSNKFHGCQTRVVPLHMRFYEPTGGGCSVGGSSALREGQSSANEDHVPSRELVVSWQHPVTRSVQPIGLLSYSDSHYNILLHRKRS